MVPSDMESRYRHLELVTSSIATRMEVQIPEMYKSSAYLFPIKLEANLK